MGETITSRGADTLGKLRPQSYRFAPKPNGMGLGMQMRTECDVLTRKRAHRLQTKPNTPETNRLGPRGAGRRAPGPGRTAHRPRRTTPRRPASVHGTGTPPPRPLPPLGGPRRAPPPSSPHGRPPAPETGARPSTPERRPRREAALSRRRHEPRLTAAGGGSRRGASVGPSSGGEGRGSSRHQP